MNEGPKAVAERGSSARTEFSLAGRMAELRGRLLRIDGADVCELSDRERSILLVLSERPGVVWSKQQLLDRVWSDDDVDLHAVEVAVGRLRKRLGPIGAAIETVIRRGYRVRPGPAY